MGMLVVGDKQYDVVRIVQRNFGVGLGSELIHKLIERWKIA